MHHSSIIDTTPSSSFNPKIEASQLITNTNEFNTYTSLHSTSSNIYDNNDNPQLQSDKENVYSSEILSNTFDTTKENLITDSDEIKQILKADINGDTIHLFVRKLAVLNIFAP